MRAASQRSDAIRIAECAQCRTLSGLRWVGWRACRIDDPEDGEPPRLALFCPACAEREFGSGAE